MSVVCICCSTNSKFSTHLSSFASVRKNSSSIAVVVISVGCSAVHSNVISDSLITPAKNASVFFDLCWKSSSRPANPFARPRPFEVVLKKAGTTKIPREEDKRAKMERGGKKNEILGLPPSGPTRRAPVWEKDSSADTISLQRRTVLLRGLGDVEGKQELLEVDEEWEEEDEGNEEGRQRERPLHALVRWLKHSDILSHAMCARHECDNRNRRRTKKTNTTRTFTCSPSVSRHCRVSCALCWSWFSRCHWCRSSDRSVGWFWTST